MLSDEARREGKSNAAYTSGKRGVVVHSDRSVSAVLGHATGRFGAAGREGTLHSDAVGVHGRPSIPKGPKTQVYLIE